MKLNKLTATIIVTLIGAFLYSLYGNAQQQNNFSSSQKAEINALIRDYILENPEIIPKAVEVLRSRQFTKALSGSQEAIYKDDYSFSMGNEDADVTIVEFYDYNCGYCKQVPEIFARLLEEDDKLRIIYKELPILAQSSEFASLAAMASMKQDKFIDFHNALMKNKRQLTEELILQIAKDNGVDEVKLLNDMADPIHEENILKTQYLVQSLGISGTPGFIIGDQIIAGFIGYDKIKEIINQARLNQKS